MTGSRDDAVPPGGDIAGRGGSLLGDHPLSKLPPVAREIVEAATRVLMRDGYKGLTLRAVAAESGVYADSIRYYFGGKEGLVRAVSLNVSHDATVSLLESVTALEDTQERVAAIADVGRRIAEDVQSYRAWFELLPHILADREWTEREAEDYEWCRRLYARYAPRRPATPDGPADPERARQLTALIVAVVDGLALQHAVDPDSIDLPATFRLWAELLAPVVEPTLGRPSQ